jgi:hypothetical protein
MVKYQTIIMDDVTIQLACQPPNQHQSPFSGTFLLQQISISYQPQPAEQSKLYLLYPTL